MSSICFGLVEALVIQVPQTEYYLLKGRGVPPTRCLGPHFMRRAEDLMGKSPPTFSSPLPGMTGSLRLLWNAAKEALHKEFFHPLQKRASLSHCIATCKNGKTFIS